MLDIVLENKPCVVFIYPQSILVNCGLNFRYRFGLSLGYRGKGPNVTKDTES